MSMRRLTRLINGFSKKVENHAQAIAIHYMHHNFCRVHQSLRITPAIQAGLTDHIWEIAELVDLPDSGPNLAIVLAALLLSRKVSDLRSARPPRDGVHL